MSLKMQPGIVHVVTKGSNDGTLEVGDHIWLERGLVHCREAQGWIDPGDADKALQGVEVAVDSQWLAARTASLELQMQELKKLTGLDKT